MFLDVGKSLPAPMSSSLSGAATAGGSSPLPASLSTLVDNPPRDGIECASISTFVDTWVSAPVRVIAPRDFTFKAVIGEPEW